MHTKFCICGVKQISARLADQQKLERVNIKDIINRNPEPAPAKHDGNKAII